MSISETYIIRVSSDLHEVDGMHVTHSSDKNLVLTPTNTGILAFCLQYNLNETALTVNDDSRSEVLSVIGPSGRGPYKLRTSPETRPFGIGSMAYHDFSMKILGDETGNHLLGIADKNINDGHWMTWRNPNANGEWVVYWVTPRPYNREDLPGGVPIKLILYSKA
ncbi:hypothetical protein FOPG_15874 [Fusarium oxysporum f. sp. conglutinans race 2 54008]|uniref:Uncharacterized protein n=1 Tax=Fusarium oxysporum f. sp. conglutinans race 2 54008 TaxID=1089457 RepID=X0GXE2_FUSOX|nr:hypothetical protein FOPG_15874 [Fusarium oxysporum f. sp. conglutinans race 2 54008]KAG6987739.1 hypothetical protein FocnCong_v002644 [Fusarium oxysporum f. sp. conglutinans]KAI8413064.1 hypothetical protein FOFC_06339 [Fusarium oxysporum]